MPVYHKYRDGYFVSISDSDRAPGLNYLATVYNGIDLTLYPFQESGGDDLIFLGRIHPDKGVHLAIEVARQSGRRLLIAGIIQDEAYFREKLRDQIDDGAHLLCRSCRRAGQERTVRARTRGSFISTQFPNDSVLCSPRPTRQEYP